MADTRTKEEKAIAIREASQSLEQIIAESGIVALREQPPLMQAISLALGMSKMRNLLTDDVCTKFFMPLQGSPLGFVTDKDTSGGYRVDVVREVVTEALLRGFRPIGNEFNIIAGRFYGAKNGFERIVHEYPGVTDVQIDLGVPQLQGDKGALVPCFARWFFRGEQQEIRCSTPEKPGDIDTRIPVKVNGGMGSDAILGKATRKLYARIYQRLTGCSRDVVDNDPSDVVQTSGAPVPPPEQDGRRIRLGKRSTEAEATAPIDPTVAQPEPGAAG